MKTEVIAGVKFLPTAFVSAIPRAHPYEQYSINLSYAGWSISYRGFLWTRQKNWRDNPGGSNDFNFTEDELKEQIKLAVASPKPYVTGFR